MLCKQRQLSLHLIRKLRQNLGGSWISIGCHDVTED
jgi:hypothetical protein